MLRLASFLLLLTFALGASSELAWAAEVQEACVELVGDLPLPHDAEETEEGDELVASDLPRGLGALMPSVPGVGLLESLPNAPQLRPPRV